MLVCKGCKQTLKSKHIKVEPPHQRSIQNTSFLHTIREGWVLVDEHLTSIFHTHQQGQQVCVDSCWLLIWKSSIDVEPFWYRGVGVSINQTILKSTAYITLLHNSTELRLPPDYSFCVQAHRLDNRCWSSHHPGSIPQIPMASQSFQAMASPVSGGWKGGMVLY